MPNHAPRRSRKAGKMGTGAERRRQRRLEEEAVRHLQSISDLTEDAFLYRLQRSREGRVIGIDLEDRINIYGIPNSIGQLKALKHLDLFHCVSLTGLPEGFGGLTALETLTLSHSYALAALPDTIGELKSLTELKLSACKSLVALPDSIGGLKALKVLDLAECESLTALPDTIGGLAALEELDLNKSAITALPDAIGGLTALKKLDLKGCSSLTALPPAIETMPNLHIEGWERPLSSNYACFAELARPRVKATFPFLEQQTEDAIDARISQFWSSVSESSRAKIDGTHDGIAYGESILSNLIKVVRRVRRRTCAACGRQGSLEEDRFPVCWCGARRYCGLECQMADWDAGHAETCASGYTWSNEDLDAYWTLNGKQAMLEKAMDILRQNTSNTNTQTLAANIQFEKEKKDIQEEKELFYAKNPPPADRRR
jgi:hypothetical protein